jgi:hypothetical protein
MTINNPNKKGTLGEIAVCKELLQLGYDVFVEFGSHSKVDLIVLDENYKTYKIQVKTIKSTNDVVQVYSIKNCLNPKYNSIYTVEQVDIFAIYIIDTDSIFYVTARELLTNSKSSKFRLSPSKNGQNKNVRYAKDYLDFKKALRDCTPHAQTDKAVGDETVQTTTPEFLAAGESQCGR